MISNYQVKNNEYSKVNHQNQSSYWKELGLNIDFLNETKLSNVDKSFTSEIKASKKAVLLEVSEILLGEENKTDNSDTVIASDLTNEQKTIFLLLKEFTLRKKKSILEFIQLTKSTIEYSSELALVWSLYNEAPNLLFDLITYHHWKNRSTDTLYTFAKSQKKEFVLKIAKEKGYRDSLCDSLYNASGKANIYKVYSYAEIGNSIIFHLYKKVNDKTVPDFEQPVRNREVKSIMFTVDLEQKRVELRDYTSKEKEAVLKYLSSTLKDKFEEVKKEPYVEYKSEIFKQSILGIDKATKVETQIEDFIISAITFNRSTLPKSPLLHFELENDDVMEAVYTAHQEGVVDLRDLKDIRSLRIKTSNSSRLIRTIPLESGDVIFSLDDSNLDEVTRKNLGEKFKKKFDIPLNQPISNIYFDIGIEEKIDYLMGIGREEKFDDTTKEKFNELIEEKLISKLKVQEPYCPICKDTFEIGITECGECEVQLKTRTRENIEVNEKQTIKHLEEKIKTFLDYPWSELKDSNITIEKKKYHFSVLYNDETGEEIRFLITTKQLSKKVINKINRMVVPTVIVYAGSSEVNIEKYNENCISTKNFGFFYVMKSKDQFDEYMKSIYKEFTQRWKLSSSRSGFEAFKNIREWLNKGSEYSDKDLEHDTYAMINDITANSVKWGAKYSGKIVPEGAFTLSYKVNRDIGKYAYTYDCKLTGQDKGYPLDIDEHRKAAQYMRVMGNSDFLKDYLNDDYITAHLIISNHVNIKKVEAMNNHFRTENMNVRVKLIKIETLVRIYEIYLEKFRDISTKPNYFKKTLVELINKDTDELKISEVEREFTRLLKTGLMEQAALDMLELTDAALKATDIREIIRK
jgi:hypothetical protein